MSVISSAPVESMMRSSSGIPGSSIGREPAAMMQWVKSIVVPSTSISFGEVNFASPVTTLTLRCLARPLSPPVSLPTTSSFQPRSLSRSISGSPKVTPNPADSSVSAITRAACSRALEGMQPTFRQMPPSTSKRSTSTTSRPRSAARNAAV